MKAYEVTLFKVVKGYSTAAIVVSAGSREEAAEMALSADLEWNDDELDVVDLDWNTIEEVHQ